MLREIGKINRVVLAIASGLALSLSFPNFNAGLIAYISFVPLFFALRESAKGRAFLISYLCGLIFFGITIFWICHVSVLAYVLLVLILSIFFGFFGVYFLYAIRYPLYTIFTVPAFWVVLEYIRSNLFSGFGWALLGYSQYLNTPVIQISDITGAYGVSFFVMMVNVVIHSILSEGIKKSAGVCLIGLLIFFGVLGYGYFKLQDTAVAEDVLDISLIQGNIPQDKKWDPRYKDHILDTYTRLTEYAAREGPDLIIWPETSLPGYMQESDLFRRVALLARNTGTYLLVGAPSYRDSSEEVIFNSAHLISEGGDIVQRYDKLHLVPFGEYIPFGGRIDFVRKLIDKPIGNFGKGGEYTIFELENGLRFGVLICFEDIFSNLVRGFVSRGADFMVNMTNDAWFKKTPAAYQHAQSSVFRALENRMPVIRAANTGLSCFIDKKGRIFDSVRVDNEEILVAGYKTNRVVISKDRSIYSRFGDVFVFLCTMLVIINGGWRWKKRRY
ncbi:apolipoprotein N-acyltransferase [Omnitrophica bacterium]|nr:apolipoprotein N-acyltransferase [Candidatus Omnitrophota bacterium]